MVGEVLEQVELRDHPDRSLVLDRDEGRGAAGEEDERLIERRGGRDEQEGRVHQLPDRPLDDRRVTVGALEQTLLADRADEPADHGAGGILGDRQLADPVLLEDRDRLADPLARPGDDERRPGARGVAIGEQLGDPVDR